MTDNEGKIGSRDIYSDGSRRAVGTAPPIGESAGGAPTSYLLVKIEAGTPLIGVIHFQPAPIPEVGVIGWTNETVLAVVKDRLEAFQKGPFPCSSNETAIALIEAAIQMLERRTEDRIKRGVEGKLEA